MVFFMIRNIVFQRFCFFTGFFFVTFLGMGAKIESWRRKMVMKILFLNRFKRKG